MRDDNRSRAGGAGPNEDVSADELLALLHKSVERDAKSAGGDKIVVDKKTAGKTPKKTAPLKIDDSTLDEARRELYQGEHDAGADDDIDVDELIRMYTKRPEKKKSRMEEPVLDKKTDAPENAAPAVNETNNDIPEDEPAGNTSSLAIKPTRKRRRIPEAARRMTHRTPTKCRYRRRLPRGARIPIPMTTRT
ncbi:MAG: hypothetical protein ACLR5G_09675 [Eubacteriales bacterium]